MRLGALIGVLVALAATSSAIARSESSRAGAGAALYRLQAKDVFEVAGSGVACRVVARAAPYPDRLICFAETAQRTYSARRNTYAVELAQGAVAVGRIGTAGPLFLRKEVAPRGAAAGSDQATNVGAPVELKTRGDRAFVAGTNIVCRAWVQSSRAVLCALVDRHGRIEDGTYLAWINAHGVRVAQEQNRRSVTVFTRVNGH